MKMSALFNYVKMAILNRIVFSIIGDSGIGKTSIVRQVCAAMGWKLIEIHAAEWDPVDVKGFPVIVDGIPTFVPYGEMKETFMPSVENPDQLTVVLFDDWGHGTEEMQKVIMQIFRGQLGMNKVPDNIRICGASNANATDGVKGAIVPFKSSQVLLDVEFEHEAFLAYIAREKWDDGFQKILKTNPEICHAPKDTKKMEKSPNPREWERAHNNFLMFQKAVNSGEISIAEMHEMEYSVYTGCVGHDAALTLVSQLKVIRHLPDPIEFLNDPQMDQMPDPIKHASATYILTETLCKLFEKEEHRTEQLRGNMWTIVGWLPKVFKRLAINNLGDIDPWLIDHPEMQTFRHHDAQDLNVI